MKFIKTFNHDSEYISYRDGAGYIKPNISLSRESKKLHYNLNANGHPYVDLGLPSGTLWATMNVGATSPSDYGKYFQWGDTSGYTADQIGIGEGQKKFAIDWSDYKWGNISNFTKYTTVGEPTLVLEDDAANKNMGGNWHMPTKEQFEELIDNTTTAWTTSDGVSGMTLTSTKGSIFIPAGGRAGDGSVVDRGTDGYVWTTTVSTNGLTYSIYYYFAQDSNFTDEVFARWNGFSVRGVLG